MELSQAILLINHQHILFLEKSTWADLGCGSGLFTNALAHLLKPNSKIFAVDKNLNVLKKIQSFNSIVIEKINADFVTEELDIENADGILMANSLHFVKDKVLFINKIRNYLKPKGCFLIVEYELYEPNPWVPYPVNYTSIKTLFGKTEYGFIHKISEVPSRFNQSKIYSVIITK